MTRDRMRPGFLVRKVLLPPVLAGGALACLLAALALTVAGGSRASADNPLGAGRSFGEISMTLSADLEGMPTARDVSRARRPVSERRRLLRRHPYYDLYAREGQRFAVAWVLVAAIHYQDTGFERTPSRRAARRAVRSIAAQLRTANVSAGLGRRAERAVQRRYGLDPKGRVSAAMVIERARAWRLLGTIPLPGSGELATPVAGVVGGCGYFGCPRPGHLHNGLDFLAPTGRPIHAADDGTVALVEGIGESGGYGNFVCLQHRPHLATCYAHLSAVAAQVRVGARVRRGETIGLVGSTGSSTSPHLHFEVRRGPAACQGCSVDPSPLLSGEVPESSVPKMLRAPEAGRASARTGDSAPPPVTAAPPPPSAPVPAPRPAPAAGSRPAPAEPVSTVRPRRTTGPTRRPRRSTRLRSVPRR